MDSLRDFVYIDESSLNSNLSSLGEGVLEEITEESAREKETGGGGKVGIPGTGIGAGGEHSRINTENVISTMTILAPYRFQRLEELVRENDIEVFDGTENRPPTRREVVRLNEEVNPMSLFKIETGIKALTGAFGGEVREALDELGVAEQNTQGSFEDMDDLKSVQQALSGLIGSIPLRMDVNGYPFAIPLDRDFTRIVAEEEFLTEREYTVFGRIERTIESSETWDPVSALRVLNRYVPEDQTSDQFRNGMAQMADRMDIRLKDEDMTLEGPGSVINPIAMYW